MKPSLSAIGPGVAVAAAIALALALPAVRAAAEEVRQENDPRIRALLGEELLVKYAPLSEWYVASPEDEGARITRPLALRPGYSATPLSESDMKRLSVVAAEFILGGDRRGRDPLSDPASLDAARGVLNAEQLEGLRQLQEERQAFQFAQPAPKSSELPRNIRIRARSALP